MELYEKEELGLPEQEDEQEERKKTKRRPWLILLLLLLLLLFFISCYLLGVRLYDMATREQYVVNMVADNSTEVEMFRMEYSNATGDITVSGMPEGDKVVAPGTENDCILRLKNEDNVDIRYVLTGAQSYFTEDDVPLEIKLSDEYGNYIIGSEYQWVSIEELNNLVHKGYIERDGIESLYFSWRWLFEGDDEYDTYLGNLEGEDIAGVNVSFLLETTGDAKEAMSPNLWLSHRHGLGCCWCCWWVLILLLLLLLSLLYIWRLRRKLRKYEDELEEWEEKEEERRLEEQALVEQALAEQASEEALGEETSGPGGV